MSQIAPQAASTTTAKRPNPAPVIPAQAGIHVLCEGCMDSRLRGNDDGEALKPLPNPQPFLLFFCVLCATSASSAFCPRIPAPATPAAQ